MMKILLLCAAVAAGATVASLLSNKKITPHAAGYAGVWS